MNATAIFNPSAPQAMDPPNFQDLHPDSTTWKHGNVLAFVSLIALWFIAFYLLLWYLKKREARRKAKAKSSSLPRPLLLPLYIHADPAQRASMSPSALSSRRSSTTLVKSPSQTTVIHTPKRPISLLSRDRTSLRNGEQRSSPIVGSIQRRGSYFYYEPASSSPESDYYHALSTDTPRPRHVPWPK